MADNVSAGGRPTDQRCDHLGRNGLWHVALVAPVDAFGGAALVERSILAFENVGLSLLGDGGGGADEARGCIPIGSADRGSRCHKPSQFGLVAFTSRGRCPT
jgi:hypothetical protein